MMHVLPSWEQNRVKLDLIHFYLCIKFGHYHKSKYLLLSIGLFRSS